MVSVVTARKRRRLHISPTFALTKAWLPNRGSNDYRRPEAAADAAHGNDSTGASRGGDPTTLTATKHSLARCDTRTFAARALFSDLSVRVCVRMFMCGRKWRQSLAVTHDVPRVSLRTHVSVVLRNESCLNVLAKYNDENDKNF